MNSTKVAKVAMAVILFLFAATVKAEEPVNFGDANLKAAVEATLGVPNPTPTDMLGLTKLEANELGISDLTGLEYATNLWFLNLSRNAINLLGPIEGLASLNFLDLGDNQISDISALSGMTLMTNLFLADNQIGTNQLDELSALSEMTDLVELNLNNNQIKYISPLSGMTKLTRLELRENQIEDISALSDMTLLTRLDLRFNQITDISALSGKNLMTNLFLGDNQIEDISVLSGMPLLTELVLRDNQIIDISPLSGMSLLTDLGLHFNQISDISPLSGMGLLTNLSLAGNQISNISPLSGMTLLTDLNLGGNQISDIYPISGMTLLTDLNLEHNPLNWEAYCTYFPIIITNNSDISILADPNPYNCDLPNEPVEFTDPALKAAVEEALGLTNPTTGDMVMLEELVAKDRGIENLIGLEYATNLRRLSIPFNRISDLSPLSSLDNLLYADIGPNLISDISPLASLVNLIELALGGNPIDDDDLSDLSGLENLQSLRLEGGPEGVFISDISPLSSLASLKDLSLVDNQIIDISALSTLDKLEKLDLNNNLVNDISDLSGLVNLRYLSLKNNQVSNVSSLSTLTGLEQLYLPNNQISTIPDLSFLILLRNLNLGNNQLSEISGLPGLINLVELDLSKNQFSTIPDLSDLIDLRNLNLRSNQLSEVSGLFELINLVELDLSRNQFSIIPDLSAMSNLEQLFLDDNQLNSTPQLPTNLLKLSFNNNQISNISSLSQITNLPFLGLARNQIDDISPLAGLVNMEVLLLDHNQINDIRWLSGMTGLLDLKLEYNQIVDISWLQYHENLSFLYLNSNPLSWDSHYVWIPIIRDNNPGIDLRYDAYSNNSLQLWLSAEGGSIGSPMATIDDTTAFGGQYIVLPTVGTNNADWPPPDGHVTYSFSVPTGTYMVWGRINALSGEDDSFWARIEGAITNTNNHPSGWIKWTGITKGDGWYWNPIRSNDDGNAYVQFTLAEGSYTLEIAYREDGTKLDHLLITDYLNLSSYEIAEITPAGSYTEVAPVDSQTGGTPVILTFDNITESGETNLSTSGSGPEPPAGFQLGDPATYYDITTTATYNGMIEVCVSYSGVTFSGPAADLKLLHYEDPLWVDCTTFVDTENEVIYGSVSSLSPFAVMVSIDADPPVFESLTVTPDVLWPPNHKMVAIEVAWEVTDNLDENPSVTLKSIEMNEGDETNTYDPTFDDTLGDGHTTDDIQIDDEGVIYLRAERSGTGEGRVYTLTYEVTDSDGNVSTASVTITVPHEAP